jgi:hypothetical protein
MYLWNYILSLIIYVIQRASYCFLSRCKISRKFFKRSTVIWLVIVMLVEGNVQFISFLLFQQVRQQPSALVFQDKVNLLIAVLFMFVALIYTIGSFVLFSSLLSKKNFHAYFWRIWQEKNTSEDFKNYFERSEIQIYSHRSKGEKRIAFMILIEYKIKEKLLRVFLVKKKKKIY